MTPNKHKCLICGKSLAGRHPSARICNDPACLSTHRHPPKIRVCRWCGKKFRSLGTKKHCGSEECSKITVAGARKRDYERKKAAKNAGVKTSRCNKVDTEITSHGSPDRKYGNVYSYAIKKPTRGHAGMHFSPSDGAAAADASWLFKGRKPETPRPPLDVKKTEVAGGWRAIHKKKYDYHLQQKGKAAIV
jgi:hypothetical protein